MTNGKAAEAEHRIFEYQLSSGGVHVPEVPVTHRDHEYDPAGFAMLWEMQLRHFWYLGRHRFLLRATHDALRETGLSDRRLSAIDLGGGCGGWIKFLADHPHPALAGLALADSSLLALEKAGNILPPSVARYQVDLLRLGWQERWEVVYLLDVLEHFPEDKKAMRQVAAALKPGGLAFLTMPALGFFWSYNDEAARHCRRYNLSDLAALAEDCGLKVLSARYFMFFLSPLLWLSRVRHARTRLSPRQKLELAERAHRIPATPINQLLAAIFAAETPLGHHVKFPWGTSVLGVFHKPAGKSGRV